MFRIYLITITFSFFCLLAAAQTNNTRLPLKNTYEILSSDTKADIINKAVHVVPTASQYAALRNEYIAFIHFGPNTFTRMEWGSGKESPEIFDLKIWIRTSGAA